MSAYRVALGAFGMHQTLPVRPVQETLTLRLLKRLLQLRYGWLTCLDLALHAHVAGNAMQRGEHAACLHLRRRL